jgi:hypothetical protein
MKTIRVFPRRTNATPDDELVYVGYPDLFAETDHVLVDCTFTWDKPEAERLAEAWNRIAPTTLGGCAYGDPGGEFTPGRFLKQGYTITSRGCNNKCWFCYVWKRSGNLRELEIKDGWNIVDDNLLACSDQHIRDVFSMLKSQKQKAKFSGGIEAKLLQEWHVELFADLKPACIFFAYDTQDDYEPLVRASQLFYRSAYNGYRKLLCYVLIGYPNDTFEKAEKRLTDVMNLQMTPFAMLYRDDTGNTSREWRRFQRSWIRPAAIRANHRIATI